MEREQAIKYMRDLLRLMVEKKGSDLFITVDFPPAIKIDGKISPVSKTKLTAENTKALVYGIMNDRQLKEFEATKDCNFAIAPPGIGRFRVNAFIQMGYTGMVLRTIETTVPTIDKLGLPQILKEIALTKRGLVIFVGATGSGKSTSLASMIDWRNDNTFGHIITVEDPIEYVHAHKNCIITQREVGVDTEDWDIALKNSLRQAPDVILLGEIRDRKTMQFGIEFAETGHLALATLHANNSNQAMDRIINFFPEDRHAQLFMDLSLNLKAVISQRLLRRATGKGRIAAIEILINTPYVSDLILKGDIHELKAAMAQSNEQGMNTFDQALFDLYEADQITYEDALRNADSMNELRLRIKLEGKSAKNKEVMDGLGHLQIEQNKQEQGFLR
jgi:twitching motility protein PilU